MAKVKNNKTKTKDVERPKKEELTPQLKILLELMRYSSISELLKMRCIEYAATASEKEIEKLIGIFENELKERIKINEKYEEKWNDFIAGQRKAFQAKLKKKLEAGEKEKIESLRKKLISQ